MFTLDGAFCVHIADDVRARIGAMPGISGCELDIPARVLLVTAEAPVDRAEVLAVLRTTGCPVRG
ncbi:heavy-metal-associated domain-containing protein [Nocardioides terrae]|uniref:heavy-metal-associated domain-containing protein n=1 Tax=Nocardioides terrae TaxID=574651 RepID=UPI0011137622|nr:heavy-metal-associated domain-containing protein [Nocardioides terrae]